MCDCHIIYDYAVCVELYVQCWTRVNLIYNIKQSNL